MSVSKRRVETNASVTEIGGPVAMERKVLPAVFAVALSFSGLVLGQEKAGAPNSVFTAQTEPQQRKTLAVGPNDKFIFTHTDKATTPGG